MISDEILALYYYDELSAGERAEVEAALARDAEAARRFAELQRRFQKWREFEPVEVPPHLIARWHDSLDRISGGAGNPARAPVAAPRLWSFSWGAAVAAALALGIGIGAYLSDGTVESPVQPIAGNASAGHTNAPASFTRSLQIHLRESESEIGRLARQTDADRALLAMQIIAQNRMFERAAVSNNSPKLARVLRAFEPILLRLASEDIAPRDAEALRAQLSFELNVMLTKLEQGPSDRAQSI